MEERRGERRMREGGREERKRGIQGGGGRERKKGMEGKMEGQSISFGVTNQMYLFGSMHIELLILKL